MNFLYDKNLDHIPFSRINLESYIPELERLVKVSLAKVEEIKKIKEPNFENVSMALEDLNYEVGMLAGIFFNINAAETSERMQEIAKEFSTILTKFDNDLNLDSVLFEKLKAVHDKRHQLGLCEESLRLLDKQYDEFVRNGALLSPEEKEKLRSIDKGLSNLSLSFGENVLNERKTIKLILSEEEVSGVPEGIKESYLDAAKQEGHEKKYLVNLDYPSYIPFMQYAENRGLREKLFRARGSLCFNESDTSNVDNIMKITDLRDKRAKILGYKNHASFVLEKRMAETEVRVNDFINDFKLKAMPRAKEELKELQEFAKENGFEGELQGWDYSFWFEKLKKKKLDFDAETLRPYFKLENVVDGVFKVADRLYGLRFEKDENIDVYHKDVTAYRVKDSNGTDVGLFYADFFPREGKNSGAWMTVFKDQMIEVSVDYRPHISIVCNFTKPSATKPSLLNFDEVLTLFHEFGHALHGLLTKCKYRSLSGTNVFWDFVELPSQVLENWCYEKDCLQLFAKHYETGELIPDNLVEKMQGLRSFGEGIATMRQIGLASVDMAWHSTPGEEIQNVSDFEKSVMRDLSVLPKVEGTNTSCSFSHIFQGGYSAGYYSYKWAEVLDADAFEAFKEKGLFNKQMADLFRKNILESGNKKHPMDLYVAFRGKEPSVDALLRRGGLVD